MRILILDDLMGEIIQLILSKAGHSVELSSDGDEAFRAYYERGPFDVVLSDLKHPSLSAEELMKHIHETNPRQAHGSRDSQCCRSHSVAAVAGFCEGA